jgi:hypothetical protein
MPHLTKADQAAADGTVLGRAHRGIMPIEDMANLLAAFAIVALMFLGVTQIALRIFTDTAVSGYIDLVELSMASMAFLGAAYCQRLGSHIRMEMLVGKLKGRSLWLIEALGAGFSIWWIRLALQFLGSLRMAINPDAVPVAVVVAKHVSEQAKDEIEEIMGDTALTEPGADGGDRT